MALASFPSISRREFEIACEHLEAKFIQKGHLQDTWLFVSLVQAHGTKYLKIVRRLPDTHTPEPELEPKERFEPEEQDMEEDDPEAMMPEQKLHHSKAVLEYDIIRSPSYQVPVLYFSIKDPLCRFPLTIETLHNYIIPPEFRSQVNDIGVMGGITVADHPITNMPVFFVHPCNTASALEASGDKGEVTPEVYLQLWMGIIGCCVWLSTPSGLMT